MIVPLYVYDKNTGAPLAGAAGSFSFAYFKRRNADGTITTLSNPSFIEPAGGGGGYYEFTIPDVQLTAGSIISFVVDFGVNASERYEFDHVHADGASVNVQTFFFFSVASGDPVSGVVAGFSLFMRRNSNGTFSDLSGSEPTIVDHGNLLYEFVISGGARPAGTAIDFILDATAAVAGRYFEDTIVDSAAVDTTRPALSNVAPSDGSAISPTDAIGFDVTDSAGNLVDVKVHVYYPSLGTFEVVWYPAISGSWGARDAGFTPKYTGARDAITNGFRFSGVMRVGGWPAPPVIVPEAVDAAGNEL